VARTKGVNVLVGPLLEVIPTAAEGIVRDEIERMARASASSLAPLGVAGYLWTASAGIESLMRVFETAAQAKPRPWWKRRAIALGWVVLGLAVACGLASVLVEIDSVFRDHPHHAFGTPPAAPKHAVRQALHAPHGKIIAATLMLAVGTALLGGFYRVAVERLPRARRRIWPGTFTAVVCWLVVSWGFGAYVVSVSSYALYYGSLAAVAVLLVWLYLTSLSLLVGAEVNADLELGKTGRVRADG
jgi:membrane protein